MTACQRTLAVMALGFSLLTVFAAQCPVGTNQTIVNEVTRFAVSWAPAAAEPSAAA